MNRLPRLIGISGAAGSGKTTVATELYIELNSKINSDWWRVMSFAAKLKQMASVSLNNVPVDLLDKQDFKAVYVGYLNMTVRQFLQQFGSVMRDQFGADFWVKQLFMDYSTDSRWIIPDVRYRNEFEELKRLGGITIRIDRPELAGNDFHPSETEWRDLPFDIVIRNDQDLNHLRKEVKKLLDLYS